VNIDFSPHMSIKKNNELVPSKVEHKEFRKANEVIAPRVMRGGTLSLLGRKVFNVLLYHTQRQGMPGVDAPEGDTINSSLYWLPLSELARDAAFNSEDTQLLKETLLKLQDIKIVTDDSKGFSSDVLVASVKIIPGKRGTKTMLGWGLHPATEKILKNPDFYTRLSMYYLTSLRTTAGIALYENMKRYVTNPSMLSRRELWEWWHDVLTGLPMGNEKPEYKYFKRDVLRPAIAEVNKTDIQVELIEHKAGRKITHLQFKVTKSVQASLELPTPPIIDVKTIERIEALGIMRREAEDMFAGQEENFLKSTLALVEARMLDSKLPAIANPAAFLRTAIRGRYVDGQKRVAAKLADKSPPSLTRIKSDSVDPIVAESRTKALSEYDQQPDEMKQEILRQFLDANPAFASYSHKTPNGKLVRQALAEWLRTASAN
jgi:hypothetical protein